MDDGSCNCVIRYRFIYLDTFSLPRHPVLWANRLQLFVNIHLQIFLSLLLIFHNHSFLSFSPFRSRHFSQFFWDVDFIFYLFELFFAITNDKEKCNCRLIHFMFSSPSTPISSIIHRLLRNLAKTQQQNLGKLKFSTRDFPFLFTLPILSNKLISILCNTLLFNYLLTFC